MKNFRECDRILVTSITRCSVDKTQTKTIKYITYKDLNKDKCMDYTNVFTILREEVKKVSKKEDFSNALEKFENVAKKVVPGFKQLVFKTSDTLYVLQELGGEILDSQQIKELPVDFKLG